MSVKIVCNFPFNRRSLCTLQQYFIKENWFFWRSRPSVLSLVRTHIYVGGGGGRGNMRFAQNLTPPPYSPEYIILVNLECELPYL